MPLSATNITLEDETDVNAYLASTTDHFEIGFSSGILYHQVDPIGFLEPIAAHADTLFIHSHFFDSQALSGMAGKDRFRPHLDEFGSIFLIVSSFCGN
ncbi:MAG: hypothetical protein CK552_01740 [Actinobacteria bacterium]|nr:MAG: hypothetical protein CK552_01740 [Actinomycetota bacterium]